MQVRTAHDLPDFRLWLIDQWRQPHGMYARIEAMLWPWSGQVPPPEPSPPGYVEGAIQRNALPHAALWWVTDEMTSLVDHAAASLPETTLTETLVPDEDGLVVFAHPLAGHQSDDGGPITTDAIVWSMGTQRRTGDPILSIVSYQHHDAGDLAGNSTHGRFIQPDSGWNPTGTATWEMGEDTEAVFPDQTDASVLSVTEDRRWLAALWLLASQPIAHSQTQNARRQARRRTERANIPATADVRLIDVRRQVTHVEQDHEPGEGRTRRPYSHRFIVGGEGGFWRQQACGPQWSERRPVWIAPFVKGPADRPLVVKETVKVLKEDP